MFLTTDEIVRLTGFKRPGAQVEWLKDHGWKFTVNGLNQPVVAVTEVARKLVGGAAPRQQEPKWEALNG